MDALSEGTLSFGHTGYTGTSIVVSPNNKTIAILLTNRVHPTRSTVSTNQTRRLFARQVADSIPVSIPGKDSAWFAGYGDKLNREMESDLELKEDMKLTFTTWHMLEDGWENQEVTIPKNASKLRFTYKTDSSTNGRGWYIQNPKLTFTNNGWQLRDY